jgi:hypothetical protein
MTVIDYGVNSILAVLDFHEVVLKVDTTNVNTNKRRVL